MKKFTILIVDDTPININILAEGLYDKYNTLIANSGKKALEIAESQSPDLILLDIVMPEMDGYEVCRELKLGTKTRHIPVIFITSKDNEQDETKGLTSGAVDYLTKPFNLDIVEARIKNHISLKWHRDTLEQNIMKQSQLVEDLRTTNENLIKTQQQLIQSEKMASLGLLVAGIAHEMNTPIGIGVTAASHLKKLAHTIQSSYENNEMTKSDLEEYISDTKEISDIILLHLNRTSDLVSSFKQVSIDQVSKDKRIFNVKSYVEDIIHSLSIRLEETTHKVTLRCPDNIELESFPGAFGQILTNLITNSLTHGYNDNEEGTITIDIVDSGSELQIRHSDNGKGIPPSAIKKIFDPFFTTKRSQGNTGLGLHIVYNIVTQSMKGSIQCESTEGEGATFIVNIPLKT